MAYRGFLQNRGRHGLLVRSTLPLIARLPFRSADFVPSPSPRSDALQSEDEMRQVCSLAAKYGKPVLANMLESGKTPILSLVRRLAPLPLPPCPPAPSSSSSSFN